MFYVFDKYFLSDDKVRLMPNKLRYWDKCICICS